jgi:hypothetical protein
MHGWRKPRGRAKRITLISLAAILVILIGGAGYGYYVTHDLNRVEVHGLNSALTKGAEAGSENMLMVGSTSSTPTTQNASTDTATAGRLHLEPWDPRACSTTWADA